MLLLLSLLLLVVVVVFFQALKCQFDLRKTENVWTESKIFHLRVNSIVACLLFMVWHSA